VTDERSDEPTPPVGTADEVAPGETPEETAEQTAVGPAQEAATGPDPAELAALAAQRAERERKRLRQTVRDMVLSMAVVLGVVLLVFRPWSGSTPDPVKVVDPAPVVSAARVELDWPVLAPVGLPATWRATSARLEVAGDGQGIVQTGYLSPSVKYVGLTQSQTKDTAFVRERTDKGEDVGTATVGGLTWTRLENEGGKQRSLVRVDDGVTYIVTGQADWPDIETFAASLRAG
jgi:RES domain-containing protein